MNLNNLKNNKKLAERLPAAICLLFIIIAWFILTEFSIIPGYLLAKPIAVLSEFNNLIMNGVLIKHWLVTTKVWLSAFMIGGLIGFSLGILIEETRFGMFFLKPLLWVLEAVPKIALAPLIYIWIGFGLKSIFFLALVACYFPILIGTIGGLNSVPKAQIALVELYRATYLKKLRYVKIPNAANNIFNGLEVGLVFALIGAVVMEFLIGSEGLGAAIQDSANVADIPATYVYIITLGASGMTATWILKNIKNRILFWNNG